MKKPKASPKRDQRKSPDTLAQPGKDTGIELTEQDLEKVSGGASDIFAKIGDIKGESRRVLTRRTGLGPHKKSRPWRVGVFRFSVSPHNVHYEGQYDERSLEWRRLGADDKAANLRKMLKGRHVERVLEVGCGTGAVLAAVAAKGIGAQHCGVDVADPNAHKDPAAFAINLAAYDGATLPFPDQSFDLVYASHVIEHVPDPRGLLREMARVARRLIYVEVPCELHVRASGRALQRTLDIGHINAFTPESFQLLLQTTGLHPEAIQLFDVSLAIQRFQSTAAVALGKFLMRRTLLRMSPGLASRLLTYHCGAMVAIVCS